MEIYCKSEVVTSPLYWGWQSSIGFIGMIDKSVYKSTHGVEEFVHCTHGSVVHMHSLLQMDSWCEIFKNLNNGASKKYDKISNATCTWILSIGVAAFDWLSLNDNIFDKRFYKSTRGVDEFVHCRHGSVFCSIHTQYAAKGLVVFQKSEINIM